MKKTTIGTPCQPFPEAEPPPDLRDRALALACRITGLDVDGQPLVEDAITPMRHLRLVAESLERFGQAIIADAREDAAVIWLRAGAIPPDPQNTERELAALRQEIEVYRKGVSELFEVPQIAAWRALPEAVREMMTRRMKAGGDTCERLARHAGEDSESYTMDAAAYRVVAAVLVAVSRPRAQTAGG